MPVAEQICTPLSADLWDNLSPQASSMDVHNPHEAVPIVTAAVVLAHANCTPFFSPKHLDFVTAKNSFLCHLGNTVFQILPKNAFFISFAHFLLFLGGSNNHSLVQTQRVYRSFSPKKNFVS